MGCEYKIYKNSAGSNQKFDLSKETKARLSFNFIYQNILVPNCVSCHGNAGGINLETYSNVKRNLSQIRRSVFDEHSMPKRSALTTKELAILWTWIEMGAPAQLPSGDSEPSQEPLTPHFDSIDRNIFQITCVKCHSPGNSAKRILLTRFELLNSPRELVLPGNADESGLILALERSDEKRMPPAKESYSKLKEEQIRVIREWINQGATN